MAWRKTCNCHGYGGCAIDRERRDVIRTSSMSTTVLQPIIASMKVSKGAETIIFHSHSRRGDDSGTYRLRGRAIRAYSIHLRCHTDTSTPIGGKPSRDMRQPIGSAAANYLVLRYVVFFEFDVALFLEGDNDEGDEEFEEEEGNDDNVDNEVDEHLGGIPCDWPNSFY
jgi:hypothetical protein